MLSTIDGRTGAFVRLGQLLMGASRADSKWSHSALVGPRGTVYEAMPAGMQQNSLQTYLDDLAAGDEVMFINVPLTPQQRINVQRAADGMVRNGIGYSFSSYLYLALKRLGLNSKWLRRRIADSSNVICSQACDVVLNRAGWKTFDDGRSYLDIIPSDYVKLLREDSRYSVIELVQRGDSGDRTLYLSDVPTSYLKQGS